MSIHFKTRALMYWEGGTSWREEEAGVLAYFEWPNGLFVRIHGLLLAQVMQRSSGIKCMTWLHIIGHSAWQLSFIGLIFLITRRPNGRMAHVAR
ncbi:hypothetical protein L2E82_19776 [Cichorium intybus]|uniref:Uncharacterized protein n=1 Tax=Cichorium intybus TaxID=13427 RepID=A0ACB9DR36_CICIN|nr:hypothetical protein L2E82_19776 [Cichorium intybus]